MELLEDIPNIEDSDYWDPKVDLLLEIVGDSSITPKELRSTLKRRYGLSTVVALNTIAYTNIKGYIKYDRATHTWSRKG